MTTLFITGIDTNIGKTVACGVLAKSLLEKGFSVYTQKIVETGCVNDLSQDLKMHESIVGRSFNHERSDLHCPYRLTTPASPHLAAKVDGVKIDDRYMAQQMLDLSSRADHLLVEGAGGLCVPLSERKLLVDFIVEQKLPIVLVTSSRLGSINHTLLSLSLCESKNIDVRAVIYNHYPTEAALIQDDTRVMLQVNLKKRFSSALWMELGDISDTFDLSDSELNILLR